jgi:predicted negative regulator of RcsB-dependent stress response
MAVYDLQEQEQLDELKAYWKQYGNLILTIILIALLAVAAVMGWNYYQGRQAGEASTVFIALQKAVTAKDAKQIKDLSGNLLEKYPGTYYAAMAALISAKASYDANDVKTAKAQLEWVVDKAKPVEFRDLARLRLANILVDEKDYDAALKLVDAGNTSGSAYAARYFDLKGDVLALQNKNADARTAYQASLNAIDAKKEAEYHKYVQEKLDSLGGAS